MTIKEAVEIVQKQVDKKISIINHEALQTLLAYVQEEVKELPDVSNWGKIIIGNYNSQTPEKIYSRSYYIDKKINELHDIASQIIRKKDEEIADLKKQKDIAIALAEKKVNISEEVYKQGFIDGLTAYAWWGKEGQEVGTGGTLLKKAVDEVEKTWNYKPSSQK